MVGRLGGELLDLIVADLSVVDVVGVHNGYGSGAVGEQCRLAVVNHHVARFRGLDGLPSEAGIAHEVVVVVAVSLNHQPGVEKAEALSSAHHDVAAVSGVVDPEEAVQLGGVQDLAGLCVQGENPAVVGQHGPWCQGRDFGLAFSPGKSIRGSGTSVLAGRGPRGRSS